MSPTFVRHVSELVEWTMVLATSSHPCLSVPTVSFSSSLPLHCPHTHVTYSTGTRQRAWKVFTVFFTFSRMVDDRRLCGTRASLMSLRTRSFEMQDDLDYHEIRDSYGYSKATRDTLLNGAHDFDSGVKNPSVQTTFSMRSAIFFLRTFFACCEAPSGL